MAAMEHRFIHARRGCGAKPDNQWMPWDTGSFMRDEVVTSLHCSTRNNAVAVFTTYSALREWCKLFQYKLSLELFYMHCIRFHSLLMR